MLKVQKTFVRAAQTATGPLLSGSITHHPQVVETLPPGAE
jgi:hypothetical protein